MKLAGSIFVITGGGSGLGAATASALVRSGAKVVIADINPDALKAHALLLGTAAFAIVGDVSKEKDAGRIIDCALERFGALHGLVNCAGISPAVLISGKRGAHSLEAFKHIVDVNLTGTFNMIRLAVDAMKGLVSDDGECRGVIVNTASVTAFEGQVAQAAYASSKAGVAGMTLPLARELAHFDIRVMCIAPGIFETPMYLAAPQSLTTALSREVPFPRRPGRPAEFGELVRHIVENDYLNGEVIRLDGAVRLPFRMSAGQDKLDSKSS